MIEQNDLRAGVAAGILDERQAASLAALAQSRQGARADLSPGDEPFELFKGFNEIFIVVGLIILSVGWTAVSMVAITGQIVNAFDAVALRAAIGAAGLWALAEYFIRKRRMVAPALMLTLLFAGNAALGITAWRSDPFLILQGNPISAVWPLLLSTVATFVFWLRFRVPIALAMVALSLFAAAIIYNAAQNGAPDDFESFFLLSAQGSFAWITLALGALTFAAAMVFDMSDPHRVTRRSANGFWLHIIAAPALVNTIALTLISSEAAYAMPLLIAFLGLIAVIAIVIDRRSFLITGVGYVVAVASTIADSGGIALTILALGVVLLLLGAFWDRVRAALMRLFGPVLPRSKLPPISL